MRQARFTWALALVLSAGLIACGGDGGGKDTKNPGGTGGGGSGGIENPGGTGGDTPDPVCGDGVVEGDEECDGGEGCADDCTLIGNACDGAINYRGDANYDPSNGQRTLVSDTGDAPSALQGSCGGEGSERVFEMILDEPTAILWLVADPGLTQYAPLTSYVLSSCDASTELSCLPPGGNGWAEVTQAGSVYLVVDGADGDEEVGFNLLTILVPLKLVGDECDPTGADNVCATGLVCKTEGGTSTCVENHAPVLTDAIVQWSKADKSQVLIAVDGTDDEGNAVNIYARVMDGNGQPVLMDGQELAGSWEMDQDVSGQTTFHGSLLLGVGGIPPWQQLEIGIEDVGGLRSNTILVTPRDQPIKAEGESCDPAGVLDKCATGTRCFGNPSVCTAGHAPVTGQTAFQKLVLPDPAPAAAPTHRVVVAGTDADDDVATMKVEFLDAAGEPVTVTGVGTSKIVEVAIRNKGFTAVFEGKLNDQVVKVRATLTDDLSLSSDPVVIDVTDQVPALAGEACNAPWVTCEVGLLCNGVCAAPTAPTATDAIYYASGTDEFFVIAGTDPDNDVVTHRIFFYDASGNPIAIDLGAGPVTQIEMPKPGFCHDGYTVFRWGTTGLKAEGAEKMGIVFIDAAGLESDELIATFGQGPAAPAASGEACTPVFEPCAAGLSCQPDSTDALVCQDPAGLRAAVCAAAPEIQADPFFAVLTLAFPQGDGLWTPPTACAPFNGPEQVFKVHVTQDVEVLGFYTTTPATLVTTAISVFPGAACPGTEAPISCSANDFVELTDVAAGDYFVVVDTERPGPIELVVYAE